MSIDDRRQSIPDAESGHFSRQTVITHPRNGPSNDRNTDQICAPKSAKAKEMTDRRRMMSMMFGDEGLRLAERYPLVAKTRHAAASIRCNSRPASSVGIR